MTEAGGLLFDEKAASMAEAFFDKILVHVKGEWAGQPFMLEPWQREEVIRPLFGWKNPDGTRRYRVAYIEIPRKNGKSSIAAGIALFLLFADGEPGAEVYSAAADREQAGIVFNLAKDMVESAPVLAGRAETFKRAIVVPELRGSYKVLSADAFTKHGLNASGIVVDELHAQPNRDLVDVLMTSTGARRQPLTVMLTTAGFNLETICGEYHDYAIQVRDGVIEDPTFLPVIYAAEVEDAPETGAASGGETEAAAPALDWTDPEQWARANPNLGVSVKEDYLENEARRARHVPAYQNTFKRLHLNIWTEQDTRWLPMDKWAACDRPFDVSLFHGAACYGGLDLASTSDLASLALVFPSEAGEPEDYAIIPFFWIPGDNITDRARRDRVPYDAWARDGLITATEGDVIDYGYIVRDIEALGEVYDIQEIAFDRWGAFQVSQQLEGLGFEVVGFGQGFASMASPTSELMRLILAGGIRHNGHRVLSWMASNMVVSSDAAGNVKPNKIKSREKIDGIVAAIMGLDRGIRHRGTDTGSVYDKRGLRTLE
jgi:phage terminase large subunit-like protein